MGMGPILIFDKSTLQSLNPDEAVWLDNFFMTNITPLFYIETLADLEKAVRSGKTPEQVVGEIAYKTPDMQSYPNMHHLSLIWGELMGRGKIEMRGFPVLGGGQPVMLEGCTGVIYKQSPEAEAFSRWQEGKFLEIERTQAKRWRRELQSADLKAMSESFREIWKQAGGPTTFADIKNLADRLIDGPDQDAVLRMGLAFATIDTDWIQQMVARWENLGRPPIREFAPYLTHVLTVDLFFHLAIVAGLIGSEPKSNKVDIAYLYYLPFCMVFTSKDNLHLRTVPYFLRSDQSFVNGLDLKADLQRIDEHFAAFPEDQKECGLFAFAKYPPNDDSYLVTRLWKKHMKPPTENCIPKEQSRRVKTLNVPPAGSDPKEILKVLDDFEAKAIPLGPDAVTAMQEPAVVTFQRVVMRSKGKWKRIPNET